MWDYGWYFISHVFQYFLNFYSLHYYFYHEKINIIFMFFFLELWCWNYVILNWLENAWENRYRELYFCISWDPKKYLNTILVNCANVLEIVINSPTRHRVRAQLALTDFRKLGWRVRLPRLPHGSLIIT